MEPLATEMLFAAAALVAIGMIAATMLKGWQGWLHLKTLEIEQRGQSPVPPGAMARIEIADLKERIRKLEAIAAGVDL